MIGLGVISVRDGCGLVANGSRTRRCGVGWDLSRGWICFSFFFFLFGLYGFSHQGAVAVGLELLFGGMWFTVGMD